MTKTARAGNPPPRNLSCARDATGLSLFPEDERDVAAFVNEQFYRLSR